MRSLEIDLLRTLLAISRYQTFARAAQHLHKTQSAVTQQMQRLQETVGTPLFVRQGRQKRLTEAGMKLVGYARQVIALNDEAIHTLTSLPHQGTIRLGAPHDIADTILPPVLRNIVRTAPQVQLEIRVDRSPFLMQALHLGEIDMTISTRHDQALDGFVLRHSPTAWICAADYVHDPEQPVPLILADEPSIFRKIGLEALERQNKVRWHIRYVAPNLVGIKAAVRAGLGVTARSIELLSQDMRALGEADAMPGLPDATFYLWIRRDPSATTQRVFDMLRSTLGHTLHPGPSSRKPPATHPF